MVRSSGWPGPWEALCQGVPAQLHHHIQLYSGCEAYRCCKHHVQLQRLLCRLRTLLASPRSLYWLLISSGSACQAAPPAAETSRAVTVMPGRACAQGGGARRG